MQGLRDQGNKGAVRAALRPELLLILGPSFPRSLVPCTSEAF